MYIYLYVHMYIHTHAFIQLYVYTLIHPGFFEPPLCDKHDILSTEVTDLISHK